MIKFDYIKNAPNPTIKINGRVIELPDAREINPWSFYDDVIIFHVRRKNDGPEENIVAISKEGEILWKFNVSNHLGVKYRFCKVWVDENKSLLARNIAGKEYKVDYKTGEVLETNYENIDLDYHDNSLRIGQKEIEFNIDEHNQGDWGYKFDGKKTKIKKIMSWRGDILFVLYGRQEDFEQGERIAAFDAQGKQIWDKGKEFNPLGLIHFMNIRDGYLYIDIGGYGLYLDMKTGVRIKEEIT